MPPDLREAEPQAATALIAHLRERPEDATKNPNELAEQFGLSPNFVRLVLSSAGPAVRRESHHFRIDLNLSFPRRLLRFATDLFEKATLQPMPFVAWTTLACVVFCALLSLLTVRSSVPMISRSDLRIAGGATAFVAMLITFLLHMACYFRRGMTRYALQGGLFVWVVLSVVFLVQVWRDMQMRTDNVRLLVTLFFIIGITGFIALVYAGIGTIMTILGGWTRLKIAERHDERMSRQELLERYFELQTRLENCGESQTSHEFWGELRPVEFFRRRPLLVATSLGLITSIPNAVLSVLAKLYPSGIDSPISFLMIVLRGSFGVIQILAYVFIGYFSRGIRESVGNAVLGRLAACLTLALPIAVYHSGAQVHGVLVQYVGGWLLVAVAWAAQIGARMQASAERNESLRRNDQATIVAEMLRIQWRLSDHRTIVCVLVVDAAKSSEMKANADPLAVEYSFREYQDWIEAICEPNGGRVHNTAGDGAVVAFRDCRRAFDSARKLQTDLPRFNQEVNRLSTPFRLRVGLHVGQVAGELDEVEFTEVIDIAAHVQAVAPISGIAATDDVVTALEGEEFVPLAKTVDGHGVSLALNPIED